VSSGKPWRVDRDLSAAQVRAAIASCFPDVDLRGEVRHLGSGWEYDAWATPDGWVFRFPRRAERARAFALESRVHDLVAEGLLPLRVPRVERLGDPGPDFPHVFAGHRFIPGVPGDHPDLVLADTAAQDLGKAVSGIHGVGEDDARRAGVELDAEGAREWYHEATEILGDLRSLPGVAPAMAWVAGGPSIPPPYQGPLRFLHNDLAPDHLLFDMEAGHPTGILDWTDAALGDPALDFVVFVTWMGWDFFREVRRHYSLELDDGFERRLAFLARVLSVSWLADALDQGSDVDKHLRWVGHAFSSPDPS
jgi:aminoglycoside phosphotransferase (APT) family kinase protein